MKHALRFFMLLSLLVPAFAHAILLEAAPAANGSVAGPDVTVQLRFNSRIDAARSKISILLPGGITRTLVLNEQSDPAMLNSKVTGLASGAYTLQWQVLAADGHISRGQVPFRVK